MCFYPVPLVATSGEVVLFPKTWSMVSCISGPSVPSGIDTSSRCVSRFGTDQQVAWSMVVEEDDLVNICKIGRKAELLSLLDEYIISEARDLS